MLRTRILIIGLTLTGLLILIAGCAGSQGVDPADTPVPTLQEEITQQAPGDAAAESDAEAAIPEEGVGDAETPAPGQADEATGPVEYSGLQLASDPLIQVESETFVGDIIASNNPAIVTLSTSGDGMAWAQSEGRFWNRDGELCTYIFSTAATGCFLAPDTYHNYPYAFFWSPGDDYIAFTENPIGLGNESDIWVFDLAQSEFRNLTDDGQEGSWVLMETGSFALDYLPMWNQQDEHIYFWRSIPDPTMPVSITLTLMRVSPKGGEAEPVREVQEIPTTNLIWFDYESWYMDGVSALSPDGRYVAVLVVSINYDESTENDGLWLVDLEDTSAPPRLLVSSEEMLAALPADAQFALSPVGLSWQAGGDRLVVMAQNNNPQIPVVLLYDVNIDTGTLTPVVDFSNLPDIESYTTPTEAGGAPPRVYSPWTATMSPNGELLLMWQSLGGQTGLLTSPLPPTGELPGLDYVSEITTAVTSRSSRGGETKVLVGNILYNLVPQQE